MSGGLTPLVLADERLRARMDVNNSRFVGFHADSPKNPFISKNDGWATRCCLRKDSGSAQLLMLYAFKNELHAQLSKELITVRIRELEYYTTNIRNIGFSAALLTGFAFGTLAAHKSSDMLDWMHPYAMDYEDVETPPPFILVTVFGLNGLQSLQVTLEVLYLSTNIAGAPRASAHWPTRACLRDFGCSDAHPLVPVAEDGLERPLYRWPRQLEPPRAAFELVAGLGRAGGRSGGASPPSPPDCSLPPRAAPRSFALACSYGLDHLHALHLPPPLHHRAWARAARAGGLSGPCRLHPRAGLQAGHPGLRLLAVPLHGLDLLQGARSHRAARPAACRAVACGQAGARAAMPLGSAECFSAPAPARAARPS